MPALPRLDPPVVEDIGTVLSDVRDPPLCLLGVMLARFFILFGLGRGLVGGTEDGVDAPEGVATPPVVLIVFATF